MASAAHQLALDEAAAGRLSPAIEGLRAAVADDLDAEALNDLAVLLWQDGDVLAARDVLAGLLRLVPGDPAARENLASIARGDMREARERLLALVLEASRATLHDNLDLLAHPWGQTLPPDGVAGPWLSDLLDVLERCDDFWHAADEPSRELLLRLFAFKVLGPAHVRLQLEPGPYRRVVLELSASLVRETGVIGAPSLPFEWQFHRYDLTDAGFPLQVVGQQLPLASTFLLSQYAHRDPSIPARPLPGDVAVDAGGCWGDTALWLAHLVGPAGAVHTFEPVTRNRRLLETNLGLNPALAERVRVWDRPLGPVPGQTIWLPDAMTAGATQQDAPGAGDVPMLELRTTTVDELVADGDLPRVDFLKVDVEGADLGVLEGAAATIRAHRPRLAIACYHKSDDLSTIPGFIASLGVPYRWYLQCSTMSDVDVVALAVPAAS